MWWYCSFSIVCHNPSGEARHFLHFLFFHSSVSFRLVFFRFFRFLPFIECVYRACRIQYDDTTLHCLPLVLVNSAAKKKCSSISLAYFFYLTQRELAPLEDWRIGKAKDTGCAGCRRVGVKREQHTDRHPFFSQMSVFGSDMDLLRWSWVRKIDVRPYRRSMRRKCHTQHRSSVTINYETEMMIVPREQNSITTTNKYCSNKHQYFVRMYV